MAINPQYLSKINYHEGIIETNCLHFIIEKNSKSNHFGFILIFSNVLINFAKINVLNLFNLKIISCILNAIKFIFCMKFLVLSKTH